MCHFITLTIDGLGYDALKSYMRERGRDAFQIENPSVRAVLKPSEDQYLTVRGPMSCDCGTGLLRYGGQSQNNDETDLAKLRRKGWSEAKIERAIAQRRNARDSRPAPADTPDFWRDVFEGLLLTPGTRSVGLLIHSYQGSIASEEFLLSRYECHAGDLERVLRDFKEDQLVVFANPSHST